MNEETREWIDKAEEDHDAAILLFKSSKPSLYAPVCFHAQQCIEKYLKALLVFHKIQFTRTHDLIALLNPLLPDYPEWELHRDPVRTLNRYATEYRYPGEERVGRSTAEDAIAIMFQIRQLIRSELNLN